MDKLTILEEQVAILVGLRDQALQRIAKKQTAISDVCELMKTVANLSTEIRETIELIRIV